MERHTAPPYSPRPQYEYYDRATSNMMPASSSGQQQQPSSQPYLPPRPPHNFHYSTAVSPPPSSRMVQQGSFRVFARLHGQLHSRIVNVDILRPPNIKTFILSIASKLKVKPAASLFAAAGSPANSSSNSTCGYQLLLDDQAVVEHISELRDGDTVVLHVLPPPAAAAAAAAAPPAREAIQGEKKKAASPLKVQEVISLEFSEEDQSRPITNTPGNLEPRSMVNEFRAEAAHGPSRAVHHNRSLASPKKTTDNSPCPDYHENRASSPTNSITSVTTLAQSVVQEAAAHIKNLGAKGSDDETSSTGAGSDKSTNNKNKKYSAVQSLPAEVNPCLESRASFETDKSVCASQKSCSSKKSTKRSRRRSTKDQESSATLNQQKQKQQLPPAKRRKKVSSSAGVRWSTKGQATSKGGIKPDDSISASKFDIAPPPPQKPQAHIPEYAVGKRYFLAYYDGHEYPITITGGIRRSNGTRRVQMDVFKVKLSVRMEELLPATPEREELWSSTCMPDAGSLCSFSSRCSTRSTKSLDYKKYGPPTNPSQCRALAMKLRDAGYGDGRLQGRWLAQRNRIVYFCCDNESVVDIQKKFPRVSVGKILYDNRSTWGKSLQKTSRMHTESFFVLPKAYYGRAVASFDNTDNEFMIPWNNCFSLASGASRG